MRVGLLLAGAAAAGLLLTGAAVARVATDPAIRDCAAANAAVDAANSTNQKALRGLDRAMTRASRYGERPETVTARDRAAQAQAELDAARDRFAQLCHYPEPVEGPAVGRGDPTPKA